MALRLPQLCTLFHTGCAPGSTSIVRNTADEKNRDLLGTGNLVEIAEMRGLTMSSAKGQSS